MNTLDARLSIYEKGVRSLSGGSGEGYEQKVLEALLARSEIAKLLKKGAQVSPKLYIRLSGLDKLLKNSSTKINNLVGAEALSEWREIHNPPEDDWWWYLDKRVSEAEERRNAWIMIIAVIFFSISFILIADILSRFLGDEGNSIDSVNPIIQFVISIVGGVLSLLGGATLVESKYPSLEKILSKLNLFKSYKAKKRAIIAGCLLLITASCRLLLPMLAKSYQEEGYTFQQQNDLTQARESYQRALRLYPDYAAAHYSLATIYDINQKSEEAAKEYQLAIEADSKFYPAYNNLARLYLLRGGEQEYGRALQRLSDGLRLMPSDERILYSFYKNIGWANLNLRNYTQAETNLRRAISLREDGAAAHCLLVYVLEALNKPGIYEACENCVAYERGEQDVEAKWVNHANELLNKGENK